MKFHEFFDAVCKSLHEAFEFAAPQAHIAKKSELLEPIYHGYQKSIVGDDEDDSYIFSTAYEVNQLDEQVS